MMNKNKVLEGDDQLWSSNVPLIAYLFVLKIMLIDDKPLLCGGPQLSGHLLVSGGWLLNGGSTVH